MAETDRQQDAIHEFELAIAADPTNDRAMVAYYKLSLVYRALHKTPEAQAALQNFQRLRAQTKARVDKKSAEIGRKRAELPVDDPEKAALLGERGNQ